jgi:uncharacterized phage infection (PIP) family protein YhgE
MPIQLNLDWNKINRLSDLEVLKSEIQKVRDEVKHFDYQAYISPTAQKKVKDFEKRYNKLMKTVGSAQRQLDREFNKLIRQVQKHRDTAEDRIDQLKILADEQKNKIEKMASTITSKVTKTTRKAPAKKTAKRAVKKAAKKVTAKASAKKTSRKKKA